MCALNVILNTIRKKIVVIFVKKWEKKLNLNQKEF